MLPCSINRHNGNNYNLFGSIIALSVSHRALSLQSYSDAILEPSTYEVVDVVVMASRTRQTRERLDAAWPGACMAVISAVISRHN